MTARFRSTIILDSEAGLPGVLEGAIPGEGAYCIATAAAWQTAMGY